MKNKIIGLLTLLLSVSVFAADYPPAISSYLVIQEKLAGDLALEKSDVLDLKSKALTTKNPELIQAIDDLAKAEGIDAQRSAFKKVSSEMVSYAKKEKVEGLYEASCPMASASWLQTKKEVKNPYYGSKMLKCGSTDKI